MFLVWAEPLLQYPIQSHDFLMKCDPFYRMKRLRLREASDHPKVHGRERRGWGRS